jgi:hypothetical protein
MAVAGLLAHVGAAHAGLADSHEVIANLVSGAVPESVSSAVSSTISPVAEKTAALIPGAASSAALQPDSLVASCLGQAHSSTRQVHFVLATGHAL